MAIEKEVNFLISSAEIASEGAQGINEVRANADDAKQLANTWGMSIDTSGNVSIDAAEVKRLEKAGKNILDIKYMVDTAQKRVNTALRRAQELVESLSQKISALDAGTYDNNVHYSATKKVRPSLPPDGASAQEVASWWSSLSDDDKQWMIEQHPDVIGNLEGVDYTSRNQANRIMLPRLKKQAEADLQKFSDDNGPYIEPALRSERDRLKNRVTALEQIEETLNRENTENPPVPRYLMQLDASGPNILAAVSQNNPDDADHIGVIVPGMTTSVAGSLGEYDGHATTMRKSAETVAANGKRSPCLNSSATTRLPVLSRLPPPSWLTTAHRSSPASSTGLVWFCGPGVLRVVGCYWWCCAHWRAYWGESQPSALWGCSSL